VPVIVLQGNVFYVCVPVLRNMLWPWEVTGISCDERPLKIVKDECNIHYPVTHVLL